MRHTRPALPLLAQRLRRHLPLILLGLAGLFVALGAVTLALTDPTDALTWRHLAALVGSWTLTWGAGYLLLRTHRPEGELLLLPPAALLTGWGLLILARVAPGFLLRQLLWLGVGTAALCGVALRRPLSRQLRRFRYTLLAAGLVLLVITLVLGVNPSGYGARLWLGLPLSSGPGLYFQPSELLKLLLVIYLAAYLAGRRSVPAQEDDLRLWPAVLGPMLLMVGLALVLLAWQQDLGAALLFYLTFLAMLYLAWGESLHVLGGLLLFVPIAVLGARFSSRVALRASIWLDPWAPEQADRAFQILQSLFALAAGGLIGEGPGLGVPTLIPAVHTDFVYAAVVEEYGLMGVLALLSIMALLLQRGLRIAQRAKSAFESLLAGGLVGLLGIQTWVIAAGNAKLIPITGVTLPFLSYGGSSLLTTMISVGLLYNLSAPHPPPLSLSLRGQRNLPPLRRTLARLGTGLLALLTTAALATGHWSVVRAPALRDYATNPRRILAELRIRRGRIVDRRGTPLAEITVDEEGFVERTYPVPEAAPVLGYATLDFGAAGIEESCAARLRGDVNRTAAEQVWSDLLDRPPHGESVRLTIDARLQRAAQDALKGHEGAVVLVDSQDGAILALASAPTYDPAAVAETWEELRDDPAAPLLNRATQGLVQPGTALATVVLGEILNAAPPLTPTRPLNREVPVNGAALTCHRPPKGRDWSAAVAAACPAPFADAGTELGMSRLASAFEAWGLTEPPPLALETVAAAWAPDASTAAREAAGQGELLVTPLQMVGVAATLGNEGKRPPLHLLASPHAGCDAPQDQTSTPVISPAQAATLREAWPTWGPEIIGQPGDALGGPDRVLSWFLGLNSARIPRYAVAVLIENPTHPDEAAGIGIRLLEKARAP